MPRHRRPDVRSHATWPQSWIQRENWEFETHRVEPSQKTTAPRDGTRMGRRRRVWQTRSLETRHKRVCTGYVACNRAVSLSARLKTSGAPDRRDLPVCEGHVRRCVPWKQVRTRGVAACHPGPRQGPAGRHLAPGRAARPRSRRRGARSRWQPAPARRARQWRS